MTLKYFEGHCSLGCHFHVHFSNPWHAFASHGLPAIAELLVQYALTFITLHNTFSSWWVVHAISSVSTVDNLQSRTPYFGHKATYQAPSTDTSPKNSDILDLASSFLSSAPFCASSSSLWPSESCAIPRRFSQWTIHNHRCLSYNAVYPWTLYAVLTTCIFLVRRQ